VTYRALRAITRDSSAPAHQTKQSTTPTVLFERNELPVDVPLVNTVDAARCAIGNLPRVRLGVPLLGSPTPLAGSCCRSTKRYGHTRTGVVHRFKRDSSKPAVESPTRSSTQWSTQRARRLTDQELLPTDCVKFGPKTFVSGPKMGCII